MSIKIDIQSQFSSLRGIEKPELVSLEHPMNDNKVPDPDLHQAALDATKYSYAPYSHIHVGAALKTPGGQIIQGANIENASYSLTNCAERVAISRAMMQWHDRSKPLYNEIVITNSKDTPMPPCGACRQVLFEMNPEATVTFQTDGGWISVKSKALLPAGFEMSDNLADKEND